MSSASLSLHLYSSVLDIKHSGRNILVCVLYSEFFDVTAHKERATKMSKRRHSKLSKAANFTILRRLGTNLLLRSVWMRLHSRFSQKTAGLFQFSRILSCGGLMLT